MALLITWRKMLSLAAFSIAGTEPQNKRPAVCWRWFTSSKDGNGERNRQSNFALPICDSGTATRLGLVPGVERRPDVGCGGRHFAQLVLNRAKLQQRDGFPRGEWAWRWCAAYQRLPDVRHADSHLARQRLGEVGQPLQFGVDEFVSHG